MTQSILDPANKTFSHQEVIHLFSYLGALFENMISGEEITPERRARVNYLFGVFWDWVAPEPVFKGRHDRFNYQVCYMADRLDLLDEANSAKARQLLQDFDKTAVNKMQYGSVDRSET